MCTHIILLSAPPLPPTPGRATVMYNPICFHCTLIMVTIRVYNDNDHTFLILANQALEGLFSRRYVLKYKSTTSTGSYINACNCYYSKLLI